MSKKRRSGNGPGPGRPVDDRPEGGSAGEGKGPPPDEGPHGDTDMQPDLDEMEREGLGAGSHGPDEDLRPDTPDEREGR
jgi:hypothetical protein